MAENPQQLKKCVVDGICAQNPVFSLMLGLCPTLAVTVSAQNGLGIGIAATVVLIGSNTIIALCKKIIPPEVRIPCYILVIATFVTMAKLLLQAYLPQLYAQLGLFIDIMVVNCIILGRAEAFAGKNNVRASVADAVGMGLGFTLGTFSIGSIREILGTGHWFGMPVMGVSFSPAIAMILPPGAFFTIGVLMIGLRVLEGRRRA
ncbi:MAG: electron transport complex subunit E [Candidatus Omnitrophica bacterium]|nr:electron transport complex subunit E [Candidatus Omnitrophota bacterium]